MKLLFTWLASTCLIASLAPASAVFAYDNDINGTVAPAVGATSYSGFLATSWIFGEVSVDPGWVGTAMWGDAVRISNPTPSPISIGVFIGVWAADGTGGGPGTLLNQGYTGTLSFPPVDNFIIVFPSGWLVPPGNFWMGYAFETVGSPTTAAEVNSLNFDLGDAPTIGTSATTALLGNQIGFLGSNPTISGPAGGYLSQSIQMLTPEPSSGMLAAGGIVLLGAAGFRRRRV